MTYRHRQLLALVTPAVLCIAVASAHGGKHDAADSTHAAVAHAEAFGRPGVAARVTRTVAITMTDAMRFQPDTLTFKRGETVRLRITNAGRIPHEFVLGNQEEIAEHAAMMRKMPDMIHADASSARVPPGKSADIVWQFSKTGKFLYACLIPGHWEAGMQGHVTVTGPVPR
jgi:uncharacterized cupredoxin-like copper-binding protein